MSMRCWRLWPARCSSATPSTLAAAPGRCRLGWCCALPGGATPAEWWTAAGPGSKVLSGGQQEHRPRAHPMPGAWARIAGTLGGRANKTPAGEPRRHRPARARLPWPRACAPPPGAARAPRPLARPPPTFRSSLPPSSNASQPSARYSPAAGAPDLPPQALLPSHLPLSQPRLHQGCSTDD